jgi:hypothetical protein
MSLLLPPKPRLALRVGVTGARALEAAQMPRLRAQAGAFFDLVSRHIAELATRQAVASSYAEPAGPASLRLLSPLARGADRLAAEAALEHGWQLHVPMPFTRDAYERDFTGAQAPEEPPLSAAEDLAQFRHLLSRAGPSWFALDGDRDGDRGAAYAAIGQHVVRHCDIVLAIWDGGHGQGQGGTADIVRYAARAGVPIWWIGAKQGEVRWIADVLDLRDVHYARYHASHTNEAPDFLTAYLDTLVEPPPVAAAHGGGLHRFVFWRRHTRRAPREVAYFSQQLPPGRWPSKAFDVLMQVASCQRATWTAPSRPADEYAAWWFDLFLAADQRASAFAARYRSTYVWVFLLAVGGLSIGVLGAWQKEVVGFDLLVSLVTFCLVVAAHVGEWHERSVEYRLLAELLRKQQTLASLHWALPVNALLRSASTDRVRWVGWLFHAFLRAALPPRGDLAQPGAQAAGCHALLTLIHEQDLYHAARERRARRATVTFEGFGKLSFLVLGCCAVARLLASDEHWGAAGMSRLAGLTTFVAGLSASFVSIRGYTELPMLAEQSCHMKAELARYRGRAERLAECARVEPPAALLSVATGTEAVSVAAYMLQDIEGWVTLFRGKGVEA